MKKGIGAGKPRLLHLTTIDYSLRVLLGHQLQRFIDEGYEVFGASAPGPYVEGLEDDGIRHLPVTSLTRQWTPVADLKALRELVLLFRRVRPDIVHTHNPKSGVLGRLAARIARVPVVVNTVHGLYFNPALPPAKRRIIALAERWAARLSHHEFFQSAEDYRMAVRTNMVRPAKASILGNGVDMRRFDTAHVDPDVVASFRHGWGAMSKKDDVVVGIVGRLVREKGYREFFEAARRITSDPANAAVTFVVIGSEEPSKEDRITPAELEAARAHGVIFHGEETKMPEAYAAMDLFVLPSYREGMPRSAIEASAMGLAIVATDIRGCREVLADRETGILVPPRDASALTSAIEGLLADRAQRAMFGEAGQTRARAKFDEELIVGRTLMVYASLGKGAAR